jgi:hypothetical protein
LFVQVNDEFIYSAETQKYSMEFMHNRKLKSE